MSLIGRPRFENHLDFPALILSPVTVMPCKKAFLFPENVLESPCPVLGSELFSNYVGRC